jgi:hypothetical protein
MNILSFNSLPIKDIYNSFVNNKSKDKSDMILEPLQSMIQLALLSVLPVGTKIAIEENILYLQLPSIIQPISRWYNIHKKDDIYFLFQVIKRFIHWYNPTINIKSPLTHELYHLIINMSIEGLNNLLKTYNSSGSNALIQVVSMYKNILESNEKDYEKILPKVDKNEKNIDIEKTNIDEVFQHIILLYNSNLIDIIFNSLIIIQKEETLDNINNYINGLNLLMSKNNKSIQNWIKVKLMI